MTDNSHTNNQNDEANGARPASETSSGDAATGAFEWNDRLVEQALNEVVGNETAPDFSERILRSLGEPSESMGSDVSLARSPWWKSRVLALATVAASIALVVFTYPAIRDARHRREVAQQQHERFSSAMKMVEEGLIPFPDEPPLVYPDPEVWEEIVDKRTKYKPVDVTDGSGLAAVDESSPRPASEPAHNGPLGEDREVSIQNGSASLTFKDGNSLPTKTSDGTRRVGRSVSSGRHAYADPNPYQQSNLSAPSPGPTRSFGEDGLESLDVSGPSKDTPFGREADREARLYLLSDLSRTNSVRKSNAAVADGRGVTATEGLVRERRNAKSDDALGLAEKEMLGAEFGKAEQNLKQSVEQNENGHVAKDRAIREYFEAKQRYEAYEEFHRPAPLNWPRDRYAKIHDNPFKVAKGETAFSTFSIDVDTASYTNVRQFITQNGCLPPPNAVRIEELVNYFDYNYAPPSAGDLPSDLANTEGSDNEPAPFAAHVEVASCPWQPKHQLVRVGLKGRVIQTDKRPLSNLVFLVDVSGSMKNPAKLPLVVDGLRHMTRELGENDRIAIVVYASSEGLALPSTSGTEQDQIMSVLDNLAAGGSTAGGAGIQLAYKVAEENFIQGGVNRVILCTDGDFNVGVSNTDALQQLAEQKAAETKVFLTVLGFGRGNLNDEMMEAVSNKGNGNYHYIDNLREARRVLVDQMSGTLVTIAKDVKIQIEFNPAKVASYRLIGYENRMLAKEDFDDDTKDAGEIGAGHTVTAIYQVCPKDAEVKPAKKPVELPTSRYQKLADSTGEDASSTGVGKESDELTDAAKSDELLTLAIRYKRPTEDVSTKLDFVVDDSNTSYESASEDFKFAASVASFGMLMRKSEHAGDASFNSVLKLAEEGLGSDEHGYRTEFIEIVKKAKSL